MRQDAPSAIPDRGFLKLIDSEREIVGGAESAAATEIAEATKPSVALNVGILAGWRDLARPAWRDAAPLRA